MTTTPSRAATAATTGGALWALLPLAWSLAHLDDAEFGTPAFVAIAAVYWIFAVLPPVLILVGLAALRRSFGAAAGRLGAAGIALSAAGLAAMALGNGIEIGSMSVGGGEVAAGHAIFLIGFLVALVGALLLGTQLIRGNGVGLARAAGWVLVLALPLGIGLGMLGGVVAPENDAGFWAAITVPTGIAWVLLGRSMAAVPQSAPAEYAPAS